MHRWARLVLGAAALVGGVIGFAMLVPGLLQAGRFGAVGELAFLVLTVFFLFAVWAGIAALRQQPNWPRLHTYLWAAQVPLVATSSFSFALCAGAGAWLYGHSSLTFGWRFQLGSYFQWGSGQAGPGVAVGANTLALALAVTAHVLGRRVASNRSIERTCPGKPGHAAHVER